MYYRIYIEADRQERLLYRYDPYFRYDKLKLVDHPARRERAPGARATKGNLSTNVMGFISPFYLDTVVMDALANQRQHYIRAETVSNSTSTQLARPALHLYRAEITTQHFCSGAECVYLAVCPVHHANFPCERASGRTNEQSSVPSMAVKELGLVLGIFRQCAFFVLLCILCVGYSVCSSVRYGWTLYNMQLGVHVHSAFHIWIYR